MEAAASGEFNEIRESVAEPALPSRIVAALLTLYAFAVPWEYSLDLGEPLGNVARIVGLLVLLCAIPAALHTKKLRTPAALDWLVLAFYLDSALSYFWSVDPDATLEKIRSYFQVMMVVWLARQFTHSARDLRWLMRGFVAGCWVLALLTFLDFTSASDIAVRQIRFVAEGQDPNDVARFLDLGLPFAALLFATEKSWPRRLIAAAYLPAGLFAVLLTASRGGFSASVVALLGSALLILTWRPRAALGAIFALTAIAGALILAVPSGTLERLATIPEQLGSSDLNDRFNIWISGWRAFAQAPWLGSGAGTFVTASRLAQGDTAHNTAIAVMVTGGLAGLALAMGILVAVARAVWQTTGLLRIALGTAFVVWAITSMVGSVEENRTTWLLFAIMAAAGRLSTERADSMRRLFASPRSRPRNPFQNTSAAAAPMPIL